MNLVEIVLSPFVFIVRHVFLLSYELSNNYGLSIMLLSFVISASLLPVFIFIEKIKKQNDAIKLKMKPLLNEIKRCYKGQERYYYIQTLHRQANYSPIKAILPAFSLLLQIPFFIAAYWFLESYTHLSGVKFGLINDLSQPDAIWGNINLLPIVMTLVNLLTAFFYTRHGDTSERKQMLIVAALFLILLFNLPAALVLYWTMNNVFSFFRLFITNKEAFKKPAGRNNWKFSFSEQINRFNLLKANLIKSLIIILVILLITNLSSIEIFDTFTVLKITLKSIAYALVLNTAIAFLGIILYPNFELSGNFKNHFKLLWPVYKNLFYILAIGAAYSQYNWALEYQSYNNLVLRIPGAIIGSFIITIILAFSFLLFQGKISFQQVLISTFNSIKTKQIKIKKLHITISLFVSIYFLVSSISYYTGFNTNLLILSITALLISGVFAFVFYNKHKNRIPKSKTIEKAPSIVNYLLPITYVGCLIFFFNPIIVYSSFPEVFSFPAIDLFAKNLVPFLMVIISSVVLFFLTPIKYRNWITAIAITFAVLSFVNTFIAPIKVGTLQMGKYIEEENMAANTGTYILEISLILAAIFTIKNILLTKYKKQTQNIVLALFIILISQSVITGINTGNFFQRNEDAINLPSNVSFAKNQQNILYIIPDMFLGMHMNQILQESPELKQELNGFTWYPNTISVSTNTGSSMCSLYGGPENNIIELNKDKRHTMSEKITREAEKYVKKVKDKGFYFTGTHMTYSTIDPMLFDAYLPKWHTDWNKWNDTLNIGGSKDLDYTILWKNALFYAMPLAIKPAIYKKGEWVNVDNETNKNSQLTQYLNQTRLLPLISDTLNSKKSFIYFHTEATHVPWHVMDKNGLLQKNVTPYENHKWFIHQLNSWFTWMKENDVYDNTKIVVVSDHGAFPPDTLLDGNYAYPYNWNEEGQKKISEKYYWRVNPVLLVKDYNENHDLKLDWRLMTNSDAPAIVFDENNPLKQPVDSNRTVPVYFVEHDSKITTFRYLDIFKAFEVRKNIYNPDNWMEIK